jgi:hypothetical protein
MAHHVFHRASVEAAAGSSGTAPTGITGLWAWYDANDASTVWADDGSTPASNGGEVQRWDDKSGNDRHVKNASATSSDVSYHTSGFGTGSTPYLFFQEGTAAWLDTDGSFSWPSTDFTIIVAIHSQELAGDGAYLVTRLNVNLGVFVSNETYGGTGPGWYDGAHTRFDGYATLIDRVGTFTWRFKSDNNAQLFEYGVGQLGSDTNYTNFSTTSNPVAIGDNGTNGANCYVSQIAIWQRSLTDDERDSVMQYMAEVYA